MSEGTKIAVPDPVCRRAKAEGKAGKAWLAHLDKTLSGLEKDWSLTIGETIEGGSAAYVAQAHDDDGNAFIIKVSTPETAKGRREADVLTLADGAGYARLLRHDEKRHALLLEQLGPRLDSLELPYQQQIDIMCATLMKAWRPVPDQSSYVNGAQKANELAAFIVQKWHAGGQPCSTEVFETALRYCQERAALYRPEATVLAHGDPHPANILVVPETDPVQFKFIDPDGLAIEPAYDLGVLLRAWNANLDLPQAYDMARSRLRHLTQQTAVPAEAIWQWAYIERVSTGLLLLEIGNAETGREFLRVAEALLIR